MLDFDSNLLLLFNQVESTTVEDNLRLIGFKNLKKLDKFDNLGELVVDSNINCIFTSIDLLHENRFVHLLHDMSLKGNNIPVIFCCYQFEERVFSTVMSLPLADMVRFDFEHGDLIKAFYFINQKRFSLEISKRKYLFVKKNKLIVKLTVSNIQFIKVEGKYLELYTRDNIYLVRSTLQGILKELPQQFFKIHQSYIINIDHVDSIDVQASEVRIKDGKIPMSRSLKKELLARYYMS